VGQEKNINIPDAPDYELITSERELEIFARGAMHCDMVAVDLEADSMFHYREKVCLLQMAANGKTVVIDALRVGNLNALRPLFADGSRCKVFHGADYDVRSLYRDFGIVIHNLFDTQLASMYLGYKETGLESVVNQRFGVELNKKYQKKDWSRRPLPDDMIAYAAADVLFLVPIAQALIKELEQKGRLAWVREECDLLSRVRPAEECSRPLSHRIKGAGRMTARQLTVLEALLQFRDSMARMKDRPLFKIMSNAAILKIATTLPNTRKALEQGDILSPRQIDMYGSAILAAVQHALIMPAEPLNCFARRKSPRLSPRVPVRVKALRTWRDQVAAKMGLDPALLFNKALIRDIAIHKPQTLEELSTVPGIHQWQVDAFGQQIINILKRMNT
jgi:ribonuclease D